MNDDTATVGVPLDDAAPPDLPQPAAGALSVGIVLLAIGTPLLATAGYQSWWYDTQLRGTTWPEPTNSGAVLFAIAALLLVAGSVSVGVGVFRLLQRSDRRAGAVRRAATMDGLRPVPQ